MAVYLIDYENVHADGLRGIENLTEPDSIYIFYTKNHCSLTFELYEKLVACQAKINLHEVSMCLKIGDPIKNALDMQLIMFTGYLIGTKQASEIYIISKDKDFLLGTEFYKKYIHDEAITLQIIPDIASINLNIDNLEQQHLQEYNNLVTSLQETMENENMISIVKQLDSESSDSFVEQEKKNANTQCQEIINIIFDNNIDQKTATEIFEIITNSNTLNKLHSEIANYYNNTQKSNAVYQKIKPHFETLRMLINQEKNFDIEYQDTIKNILGNNIDKKTLTEIGEIIKKSNTLVELHNALVKYYRNTEKIKITYQKLKPEFESLHKLAKKF
ncbi:MAG: hypothetical protein HDT22_07915 [Ruminococcus sp.]|nr:hypothetical protein [Ruminococcus sp.]